VLRKAGQISNKILVIKRRELVMAKNWSAAEAARVAFEGKNKEAIQDIGKRFPLFLSAASRGSEGLLEIIGALHPERITARTIEAKLKEGLEDAEDVEEEETSAKPAKTEKKEKAEKPAKKEKPASKKPAKVEEPEEDEDEDDEEEELPLEEMSLAELKAEAKKRKISVKGLKPKDIIKAIKAADAEEEDDEDEEDDDDDWDI
jgi:hypothetical protein